jgi:hypothetical protein
MKLGKRTRWTILFFIFSLLVAGCSTSSQGGANETVEFAGIKCSVYYRPTAGQPLGENIVTFTEHGDQESIELEDMTFNAQYFTDQYEGTSLSMSVTNLVDGSELIRQLFQIDREKGLRDQFIGGHGFTGLVYIFHPDSTAEMQYFCQVQ